MSTRKPHRLHLSSTDSEVNHAICLMQLRDAGISVPRTTVLSARVSGGARDNLRALSRRLGVTPSRLLGSMITMLADAGTVAPTPGDLKTLRAVCSALGVPADSDADTIRTALRALLEAAEVPPEPNEADPIAQSPDPPPVDPFAATKLSRDLAARGMTRNEYDRRKAEITASMRRNATKPKAPRK